MRKLPAIIAAAGLLVSLSACASTPSAFAGCTTGANAALVKADGTFADDPAASFPTPLVSKTTEVSVVSKGDGATVRSDKGVDVAVSIYHGDTGDVVTTQNGELITAVLRVFVEGQLPFVSATSCATVGSRVVTTGTALDLLGDSTAASLGLDPAEAIVIVSDIKTSFPAKANGADQLLPTGFPGVVLAPNGRPGITIPSGAVPTEYQWAALKQGSGDTVAEGDQVIANVMAVNWNTKEPLTTTSWDNGAPVTLTAADATSGNTGVIPGIAKAIIGQQVGSQLMIIVPPKYGYPDGSAPDGVSSGDTLFYVIDILAIG